MPPVDPCNHDAMVHTSAPVVYPLPVRSSPARVVRIEVSIDAQGHVTNTKILHSGGADAFDRSAVEAVSESTYYPKIVACKPVPSAYVFEVTFEPK